MSTYHTWKKGEHLWLSDHFHTREFDCHCTHPECVEQKISIDLVERLDATRTEHRFPIVVTSGYRCRAHQADLLKSPDIETVANSTHTLGEAADIMSTHYRELGLVLPRHFKAIGTGKGAYHVDTRADKIRRWTYTKGM